MTTYSRRVGPPWVRRKGIAHLPRILVSITGLNMKRSLQYVAAALATLGMAAPQVALAANPPAAARPAAAKVADVALHQGTLLAGQLVDAQGIPVANAKVAVSQGNWTVAETKTTKDGVFAVRNLKGGVYTVNAAGTQAVYRVWTAETAPPSAKPAVLLVHGDAARGQFGGGLLSALGNPWVLGGIVAAAIAIPIALDDDDNS